MECLEIFIFIRESSTGNLYLVLVVNRRRDNTRTLTTAGLESNGPASVQACQPLPTHLVLVSSAVHAI